MADDIDIEEHDVLDNPAIRSIFPDISIIKKEISQYYEDVPNIKQEPDINTFNEKPQTNQITPSNADECVRNLRKDSHRKPFPLKDIVDNCDTVHNLEQKPVQGNKIILGSKPSNTLEETKDRESNVSKGRKISLESVVRIPKVVLQDLGAYIYNNERYCKDCQTLFPNRSDLDCHTEKVHSVKTRTYQENVKVTFEKASFAQNRNKCNICGSCFSSNSNLDRHYRNVHKKKTTVRSKYKRNEIVIRTNNSPHVPSINKKMRSQSKNTKLDANICFHCKEPFPDYKSLIEHIYKVLEPKRYPKEKLSKNLASDKEKCVTLTEKSKGEPSNSAICENDCQNLKDKLTFEDQDSDASESQFLGTIENKNLESNVKQKKKQAIASFDRLKRETRRSTKINSERQSINDCRTLTNKRKRENQDVDVSESRSLKTNERNVNQLLLGSKSFSKKQKHEVKHVNEIEFSSVSSKNNHKNQDLRRSKDLNVKQKTKNLSLDSPGPKTTKQTNKTKRANANNELLSINSDNEINQEEVQFNESDGDDLKDRLVYECIYCSYVVPTARAYHMHVVGKHKVEKILRANRVFFDEQCKFCPSKCTTDKARNKHLYTYHHDLVYKHFPNETRKAEKKHKKLKNPVFKMFESFVLESIIYKCNKCDIHFLSSCIAKDHEKHMELLINWKCSICRRIFKKHDKHLHLKQHNFSKSLNVCQFNESELSRLLYNCTKCAIHFTEERYLEHYTKCDVETPDSVYCKKCDVLIDKHGYKTHETYHRMGKNTADFAIIAADIITMPKSKEIEVVKKRTRLYEQLNCLTFCATCKSYLTDMGLTRKTHSESRCSEIIKYTCNLCGLVLTNKAMGTHREHHRKDKDLKLQDFKFFDLKGIQIKPPLPEYPCCNNCEVYFVSRNAVLSHICSEIEHLTCPICNIKLSENAFKLHMNFHNYSMVKSSPDTSQAVVASESQEQKFDPNKSIIKINQNSDTAIECEHKDVIVDHIARDNPKNNIVYSCQSCKIAVNAYDKVIEHCQNHFSPTPKVFSTLKICSKCSLKFETNTYEAHQKLHSRCDVIQYLNFDPMYFTSENNIWLQHIFASIPQLVQKEIVRESIYQHECRIKMEVVQKGPSYLTVYKCSKCGYFIDPDCLLAHIKDPCLKNVRKYPCSVCGLPFMANVFRSKHEKIHKRYDSARLKSYNIVLINCEAHNSYNTSILNAIKQYFLYQCRTCNGVVDKLQRNAHQCNVKDLRKCPICRLLFYKDDFEMHVSKHTDLPMFNAANIKVILFGNNDASNLIKKVSPSFGGMVLDYTLYKCAKCEVCVNNELSISKHVCIFNDSRWKCPKCGYYICARLSLKRHIKMHDVDLEFKTENIQIIDFDLTKGNENNSDDNNSKGETRPADDKERELESNADCINISTGQETVSLYKCACGLHYMDILNAKNHVQECSPKIKVIRQICSKCSLVFNPKELFSHIIAHHGDKNNTHKFEIIEISPENEDSI